MTDYDSDVYKTHDLALAAAIVAAGLTVYKIEKTKYGKAVFIFTRDEKLDIIVDCYWGDRLEVNPKAYFDVIKHLKTRIYSEE